MSEQSAASSFRAKRVLITGATGMVGSWLTRRLVEAGSDVVALVLDWDPHSELIKSGTINEVAVVNGNVEDFATVERAVVSHDIECVFHLAAQPIVGAARRSPLGALETNVRGTWNVLEACRLHRDAVTRVVVASSDKAYGHHGEVDYSETTPLIGREPYEVSKSCADLIAQAYAHSYELPIVVARCGNIYGGGDLNWSRLVPGAFSALLRGERFLIRSDGTLQRDYLFVEDIVDAYLTLAAALDDPDFFGQAFNFGEDRPRSVLEMYAAIAATVGREDLEPLVLNEAKGELVYQHLDSTKAARELRWKPSWSLERGLARTAEWYGEYCGRGMR